MQRTPRLSFAIAVVAVLALGACSPGGDESTAATSSSTSSAATTSAATGGSTTTQPGTPSTDTSTTTLPIENLHVMLTEVGAGFVHPVLLVADPDGVDDYVVEQRGTITTLTGRRLALDIADDVRFEGEQGLLGLAFHPDFASNRLAYVNYSDEDSATIVEEFTVAPDGDFDVASRRTILRVAQPAGNHNGGMIAFGPAGHLWIGMGDGGGSNDQFGTAQDTASLLGSMLRISVGSDTEGAYDIPADNPFAGGAGGAPEVWAVGLRNPWRFSFDGADVWIADVGQARIEEVDLADATVPGLNYGWSVMEGSECFREDNCNTEPFVLPITEFTHDDGCSITGGYVYRGSAMPELAGHYFYSDFCGGFLRSIRPGDGDRDWTPDVGRIPSPTGFGVGSDGEMYVVSQSGSIVRLDRAP
ncbi:MAG: PQQ-dependent sugar dehydrogenase [Acidimicrobiia bacterium]